MPGTSIKTFDPVYHKPLAVIPASAVVWSSGNSRWDGWIVERHRFEKVATPEFEIHDHSLTIQLSKPAQIDGQIDGRFESLCGRPGDICLLTAGAPRRLTTAKPLELLVVTLSPAALSEIVPEAGRALKPALMNRRQLRDPLIEQIGMALKAEAESDYLSGRLYGESLLAALAAHLIAKYSVERPLICDQKGGMSPASLRRVIEFIHGNLSEDLRLKQLAAIARLNPYRFSHNFKHTTGLAPHQYVIRERISQAKLLLRETDASIITIAYAVGCSSPSQFTSFFRRVAGVTPSDYRASFK